MLGALFGALAGLATVVGVAYAVWPKPEPLATKLAPRLKVLDSANQNLTDVLEELKSSSSTKLARARRDTAMSHTRAAATFVGATSAEGTEDEQLMAAVEAALAAERTYLETVEAFLRRKTTQAQQEQFWQISEDLRNQVDVVNASVSVITSESIGGADVLSQWFRRKTGDATAIKKFPKPQQTIAAQQIPTKTQCRDDADNDGDGFVDLNDPGCENRWDDREATPPPKPECANGADDDGDGLIDDADPGCQSGTTETETPKPECANGLDDDGDGKIDDADPGCQDGTTETETEPPKPECANGLDDDSDGKIDDADPGCQSGVTEAEPAP
jgi:hypothetical protein